jgi:hypothetical protein
LRCADRTAHFADRCQNGTFCDGCIDVVGLLQQIDFSRALLEGLVVYSPGDDKYCRSASSIKLFLRFVQRNNL